MRTQTNSFNIAELRGLACILLVAYHVVGVPGTGMRVEDDSLYRYATSSFELIRMPLFTFISGLVYAYRPTKPDGLGSFFLKKLRRLGFPFVVVSTLFYLVQSHAPGTNNGFAPDSMWEIYVFSYAHFWYLQALFLIFGLVGVLDAARQIDRPLPFMALMGLAVLASLTIHTQANPFSINEAIVLLPHFLAGVAVTRFRDRLPRRALLGAGALALGIGLVVHQASLLGVIHHYFGWNSVVALLCGMGGAITLLHVMPSSLVFRTVGKSSYAIYLHHAFFTAGARVVLHRLGFDDAVVFWVALLAGLTGPMVLEALVQARPWTRVALVGKA